MSYATEQEVLDRMGHGSATDAVLMNRITDALAGAKTAIDNLTNRPDGFDSVTETRVFGVGYHSYELALPDIQSITTLKLDDDDDGVYETTIAATDYELIRPSASTAWPYNRLRLIEREFPCTGRRHYRVQIAGTWGWATIPAPINQACSLLASRLAQRANTALFGVQSFGDVGAAAIRSSDPDVAMMVQPYRIIGVA